MAIIDTILFPFDLVMRLLILMFKYSGLQYLFLLTKTGQNTQFIYNTLDFLKPEQKSTILYHIRIFLLAQLLYTATIIIDKYNMQFMYNALGQRMSVQFYLSIKYYFATIIISQLARAFLRQFRRDVYARWHLQTSKATIDTLYKNPTIFSKTHEVENSDSILSDDLPDSIDYATVTTIHYFFTAINCIINATMLIHISPQLIYLLFGYVAMMYATLSPMADQKREVIKKFEDTARKIRSTFLQQKADASIIAAKTNENGLPYNKDRLIERIQQANSVYKDEKIVIDTQFSFISKTLSKCIVPLIAIFLCGDLMSGQISLGAFMLSIKVFMELSSDLLLMIQNVNMYNKFDTAANRVMNLFEHTGLYNKQTHSFDLTQFNPASSQDIKPNRLNEDTNPNATPNTTIEVNNMSFARGEEQFFNNFNESISEGSKVKIISTENGAGKSTFFSLLLGNESPSEGSISIQRDQICHIGPNTPQHHIEVIGNIKAFLESDEEMTAFDFYANPAIWQGLFQPNIYNSEVHVVALMREFIKMYAYISDALDQTQLPTGNNALYDNINSMDIKLIKHIFTHIDSSGQEQTAYFCANIIASMHLGKHIYLWDECFGNLADNWKERIAHIVGTKLRETSILHIAHSGSSIKYHSIWSKNPVHGESTGFSIQMAHTA